MTIVETDEKSTELMERIITTIMEKVTESPEEAKYILGRMLKNETTARKILEDIIEVTSSKEILQEVDWVLDDTFDIITNEKDTGFIEKFRRRIKEARAFNQRIDEDTALSYLLEKETQLSVDAYETLLKGVPLEKVEAKAKGFSEGVSLIVFQALARVTKDKGLIKEMAKNSRSEIRKEIAKRTDIEPNILYPLLEDNSNAVVKNAIENELFDPNRELYEDLYNKYKKEKMYNPLKTLLEKEVSKTADVVEVIKILPSGYVSRRMCERLARELSKEEYYELYKEIWDTHKDILWYCLADEYKAIESIRLEEGLN